MRVRQHRLSRDARHGFYYTRIRIGGIPRFFSFGGNRRQAEERLRELEDRIARGEVAFAAQASTQVRAGDGRRDIRIEELVHSYLEWVEANRSPTTVETKAYYLRDFVQFVGACMASSLTPMTLSRFHAWARKEHGHSENGGNMHLRHVKTMLLWADRMDVCSLPFRKFPEIQDRPSRARGFTDEELRKLLDIAPADFGDLVRFALLTGLRPQELCRLTFADVRVGQDGAPRILLGDHKTYSRTRRARWVALSSPAHEIIRRQAGRNPGSTAVFLNDDGRPYGAGSLRQRLKRWCRRAGIPALPPYALRHSYGTRQLSVSGDLDLVAKMMGHTNIQTTCRYIDQVPRYCQEAAEKLGNSLGGLLNPRPAETNSRQKLSCGLSCTASPAKAGETGGDATH